MSLKVVIQIALASVMRKLKKMITLAALILTFSTYLQAQVREARVESVSGSGCDINGVSVAFSPDYKAVSILYDRLTAEAPPGIPGARSNCSVTVVFDIEPGYIMSVSGADVRGSVQVASGKTTIKISHGGTVTDAVGLSRLNLSEDFYKSNSNFLLKTDISKSPIVSRCIPGQKLARLRFTTNISIDTLKKNTGGTSLTFIDSTDFAGNTSQVKYRMGIGKNSNAVCK